MKAKSISKSLQSAVETAKKHEIGGHPLSTAFLQRKMSINYLFAKKIIELISLQKYEEIV